MEQGGKREISSLRGWRKVGCCAWTAGFIKSPTNKPMASSEALQGALKHEDKLCNIRAKFISCV